MSAPQKIWNHDSLLKFRNAGETADLYIYDVIGDDFFGITAKQVAAELKAAKNVKDITVRINSPGGSVFESYSIYALLKDHAATKTVKVDGLAASGASVIAMAGDSIEMAKASMMMVHQAWTMAMGSADELRATADILDKMNGQLTSLYADRTGQPEETVSAMLAAETWMTAEEALANGFATSINSAADNMAAFIDPEKFKVYKAIPKAYREPLTEEQIKRMKMYEISNKINAEKAWTPKLYCDTPL